MKKIFLLSFLVFGMSIVLTACNSNVSKQILSPFQTILPAQTPATNPTKTESDNTNIGGAIGKSMDSVDKEKFSHALDKPLGKSTQWKNAISGMTYTVVPTRKVVINNNSFCREYTVKEEKGDKSREFNGTACVDANSNWIAVN